MLAGASEDRILEAFEKMTNAKSSFDMDLYGNGMASVKITQSLLNV
jgi:hypothetical protein